MAILYKIHKISRKYSDGRVDPANNKWYPRAVAIGTKNLDQLAEEVAYATTGTKADCLAVITALVRVMNNALQDSYNVKLDGLGTFRVGLKGQGSPSLEQFTVAKNIVGYRVGFRPQYTVNSATGVRTNSLVNEPTFKKVVSLVGKGTEAEGGGGNP